MVNEQSLECLSDESLSNLSSNRHSANVSAGSFASQDPSSHLVQDLWGPRICCCSSQILLERVALLLILKGTLKRQHGESLFAKDSGYILASDP